MRALNKIGLASVVLATSVQQALAFTFGDSTLVKDSVRGSSESADQAVQTLVGRAIGFLYVLAVLYGLWGGFQIMTAAGEDDKVKKGKTIITQALIGLVVIFLANSVVTWIIGSILK